MSLKDLSDATLQRKYLVAGEAFGSVLGLISLAGRSTDFEEVFKTWERLEAEYVKRGYVPHTPNEFVRLAHFGRQLKQVGRRRRKQTRPRRHALLERAILFPQQEA